MADPLKGRRILATGVGGGVGQAIEHMAAVGAKIALDIDAVEGAAFDIVLESVGGDLGSSAAHKLRPGGQFLWFGQASGNPITLDFFRLLQDGTSLTLRHFVYADGSRDAADIGAPLDLASQGRLRVEIGHRGDWSSAGPVLRVRRPPARQGGPERRLTSPDPAGTTSPQPANPRTPAQHRPMAGFADAPSPPLGQAVLLAEMRGGLRQGRDTAMTHARR
ncbi:hypothetical protein ACWD4T_52750, partial [Streptomyces umbrinus]